MTRPTHQLILSLKGKSPLRWLSDMGLSEFADGDSLKNVFGFIRQRFDMEAEIEESSLPKLTYRFDNIHINYDRRDYSPSMMKGKTIVKGFTDFGQRIPLGKLPKDIEMDTVGNCIHHIYRLCKNSYPDESIVSNVISSYGLTMTLCDIKEIQ